MLACKELKKWIRKREITNKEGIKIRVAPRVPSRRSFWLTQLADYLYSRVNKDHFIFIFFYIIIIRGNAKNTVRSQIQAQVFFYQIVSKPLTDIINTRIVLSAGWNFPIYHSLPSITGEGSANGRSPQYYHSLAVILYCSQANISDYYSAGILPSPYYLDSIHKLVFDVSRIFPCACHHIRTNHPQPHHWHHQ